MPSLPSGAEWVATCFTSLLLVVAGAIKIARPNAAAGSLRRSSARLMARPQRSLHRITRGVGAIECGTAVAAMFAAGHALTVVSGLVFALFAAFVVLTNSARRRGDSCGCWGSLSDGPAGVNEVRNRVIFAAVALVPFAGHLAESSARRMPLGVGVTVAIVGLMVARLATRSSLPAAARRFVSVIAIGVSKGAGIGPREATRNERSAVLAALRDDATVRNVEVHLSTEPRLAWRKARVTSPRDAAPNSGNFLVSVPGDGGNLRVVVNHGRTLMVIGESDHEVVTFSGSRLVVTPKAPAPSSSATITSTSTSAIA